MSYTVQGKAGSLLRCTDPFGDLSLIRMRRHEPCHLHVALSFKELLTLLITPTAMAGPQTQHSGSASRLAFGLLWLGYVHYQIIFRPPSLTPSSLLASAATSPMRPLSLQEYLSLQVSTYIQTPHSFLTLAFSGTGPGSGTLYFPTSMLLGAHLHYQHLSSLKLICLPRGR